MDMSIIQQQANEWAQTPVAQQYMASTYGMPSNQSTGMGGFGATDGYSQYLLDLINSNSANPAFQKQMLGYFLDYTSPLNQQSLEAQQAEQDRYGTQMLLETALSALTSEDPGMQQIGQTLLLESLGSFRPDIRDTIDSTVTGYSQQPASFGDIKRQGAANIIGGEDAAGLTGNQYDWYNFLTNATDEQIRQYEDMRKPGILGKFAGGYGGTGIWNPFDASFWSPEAAARAKFGFTDYR